MPLDPGLMTRLEQSKHSSDVVILQAVRELQQRFRPLYQAAIPDCLQKQALREAHHTITSLHAEVSRLTSQTADLRGRLLTIEANKRQRKSNPQEDAITKGLISSDDEVLTKSIVEAARSTMKLFVIFHSPYTGEYLFEKPNVTWALHDTSARYHSAMPENINIGRALDLRSVARPAFLKLIDTKNSLFCDKVSAQHQMLRQTLKERFSHS